MTVDQPIAEIKQIYPSVAIDCQYVVSYLTDGIYFATDYPSIRFILKQFSFLSEIQ